MVSLSQSLRAWGRVGVCVVVDGEGVEEEDGNFERAVVKDGRHDQSMNRVKRIESWGRKVVEWGRVAQTRSGKEDG